jgi:hypothetical protein
MNIYVTSVYLVIAIISMRIFAGMLYAPRLRRWSEGWSDYRSQPGAGSALLIGGICALMWPLAWLVVAGNTIESKRPQTMRWTFIRTFMHFTPATKREIRIAIRDRRIKELESSDEH